MNRFVLMYHDIITATLYESGFDTPGANFYKISMSVFETHLDSIRTLIREQRIDKEEIVFTFDDGGVSAYTYIAPLLEKYGFNGHFFVVTDKIGCSGFMTEEQLKELENRNHVIGSHSASHPSKLDELPFEFRLKEWKTSIDRLESILSHPVKEISIPNGYFSCDDVAPLHMLGVKVIFTSKYGEFLHGNDTIVCGRYAITSGTTAEAITKFLSNGYYRRLYQLRQTFLLALKRILGKKYIELKKIIRKYI